MSDTGNYFCEAGVSHMSEYILLSDFRTSKIQINVKGNSLTTLVHIQ